MVFQLHERLKADTFPVAELSLSSLLLMNNQRFPWLILVPRVEGARELIDLPKAQQHQLMDEIAQMSDLLKRWCNPDKINVATLGNQVPMLHVHVIARFTTDSAWPNPVWGAGGEVYTDSRSVIEVIRSHI